MNKINQKEKHENNILTENPLTNNELKDNINTISVTSKNSQNSLQEEFLYFKNDILKDIKNTENKLNEIFITQNYSCQKKIEVIETKINTLTQKIADLSNNIPNESRNSEKITSLEDFYKNAKETLYTHDYRIKKIDKDLQEALIKYDKIIVDSLFYPGVIGKNDKFQTFRELIEFLLNNVNKLLNYKAKIELENKNKSKINEFINKFIQNEFTNNAYTEFVKSLIKENELIYINKINNLNKQIKEINDKYIKYQEDVKNNINNIVKENMKEFYSNFEGKNINGENSNKKLKDNVKDLEMLELEVNNIKWILIELLGKLNMNNTFSKKRNSKLKNINRNYNRIFNSDISKILLNNINSNEINLNDITDNNINEKMNNKNVKINYPFLKNKNSIIKQYINCVIKISDINKHDKIIQDETKTINNNNFNKQYNEKLIFKDNINNKKQLNNKSIIDNDKIRESKILENELFNNEIKVNNKDNIKNEENIITTNKTNSFIDLNIRKNENFKNNNTIYTDKDYSNLKLKKISLNINNF